jgi:hypothetical protein
MSGRTQPVISPTYVIAWSLPSLLSVLLFAFVFPMNKTLIWPHSIIAEGSFYWFLTVTPATIIVAVVRVMRCSRRHQLELRLKVVAWGLIVFSIMLNGVVLAGLLTVFYY